MSDTLIHVDEVVQVKASLPKALYAVTWNGLTAKGRKQRQTLTFLKKADAEDAEKRLAGWGDGPTVLVAELDWRERDAEV